MRSWLLLLGGLLIWAAHFFSLYGVASLFPGQALAHYLVVALTLVAAAACTWLLVRMIGRIRAPAYDDFANWVHRFAAFEAALALVAVLYQGMPALLV